MHRPEEECTPGQQHECECKCIRGFCTKERCWDEMEEGQTTTYCVGFGLRMARDVTFGDLRRVCARLNAKFGQGHEFIPEAITEGGIEWARWPGKTAGMYKTFRLHCHEHKYPTLQERGGETTAEEHVAYPMPRTRKKRMGTMVKAFGGAPVWTLKELRALADALEQEAGLRAMRSTFPRAAALTTEAPK